MFFLPPLLPALLLITILVLALLGLLLARPTEPEQHLFPWLFLPLVLVPHLLVVARLAFAGMASFYIAWPATMGPLALVYAYLFRRFLGWNDPLFWLLGLGLAVLWLGLVRWLWQRWEWVVAYGLWLLGLLLPAVWLYAWLLPPD